MQHDRAGVEDRTAALRGARRAIESFGGDWRSIALRAAHGRDASGNSRANRGIDTAADALAARHPEMFPDQGRQHNTDRLFELLAAGNPTPMTEAEGYASALEELRRYPSSPPKEREYRGPKGDAYEGPARGRKAKAATDDVPFSAEAVAAWTPDRLRAFSRGVGAPDRGEAEALAARLSGLPPAELRALRLWLGLPVSRRAGLVEALAARMR